MNPEDTLSDAQRAALASARAARLSYGVRVLVSPRGRVLVVIGEGHLKLARAERIGRALVDAFALRGVETVQVRRLFGGRLVHALVVAPRALLRTLSFHAIRNSTIPYARSRPTGHTELLEATDDVPLGLHVGTAYLALFFGAVYALIAMRLLSRVVPIPGVPMALVVMIVAALELHLVLGLPPAILFRRRAWSWMLHPFVAIIAVRDTLMARGTIRMLVEHPGAEPALTIMGRAHLSGYQHELTTKHGFTAHAAR